MVNEQEYQIPEKERFNTGIGYYGRVNQCLNEELGAIMAGDKLSRYKILYGLHQDLLAKCEIGSKDEEAFDEMMKEVLYWFDRKKRNIGKYFPDNILQKWSRFLRAYMEKKNMLTPKGEDPNRALSGGSF